MEVEIESSWNKRLAEEFEQDYFKQLAERVQYAYQTETVYPVSTDVFSAFRLCPFDMVKVVILGQDPYHGPGQAHGLCFSVQDGTPAPPSLQNIYKEIAADTGIEVTQSGNLERWAKQGVLLLNATLTVEAGTAGAHQGWGWEQFTDAVIKKISSERKHVVFLLWGNYARSKAALIDQATHLVLEAPHPSPLSAHRGFFGCKHFSQTNKYLNKNNLKPIQW